MKKEDIKKVVLAYSGGLDTSVIIPWLKENYNNCEVIAVTADLGQGDELDPVHDKALKSGASKCYILDLKEEFIADYVWPVVKAGAVYEKKYLLGTSFARPLIAKRLVEIAEKEGADAVAHGATGKGNDQVRFELSVKALAPQLAIIAPWREWSIRSREDAIDFAEAHNIPIPVTKEHDYSMDRNMWHLSHEGSDLEDPWNAPKDALFIVTNTPETAPDKAEYVELEFEQGVPVAVNGKKMSPATIVENLNEIGIRNGVGICDMVENRLVGMKSRGVYETPGGSIIYYAHNELENLCLDRATMSYKQMVGIKYSELVYDGMWFSPLREALAAFVDETQKTVTGTVRLKLYKGNIISAGAKSTYSLYSQEYVTFGADEVYNQADASGFINLFGLPLTVRALMKQGKLK
ncbi:argininosuccinate synthase [Phascolarctobacterium faecium]|uniref:argininosuccinate synthase n=2 Tax=Phascolarctobacterium faecium TaxID=33025 RepID=UPI001D06BE4A|nr:argininosuccinate synthase [Phascolarctobacterium faecium]MCB6573404.1 argininosuccinate synthase [Phascolarctobacterium faecium]MCG4857681.1 argininosuccinate synthase [Phascolarctobacterium faecium]MCQ5196967.1 argininosuccinate synthase [Phascolarctobacterium faecium]